MTGLSCIYCVGDQDEAQRCFDQLPKELVTHIWAAFAHKAGLCPHPGVYAGPVPKDYDPKDPIALT
jgi:hypothetical protein